MGDVTAALRQFVTHGRDLVTERFDWGEITWLDNADLTGSETLTVGLVVIDPGKSNPAHRHPSCDEALYLLEGQLEHTIDDEVYQLAPGSLIHVPRGCRHQATNTGAVPARMVVSYDTGRREIEMA